MAVQCLAVLELYQHRVALRRIKQAEGKLEHRSVSQYSNSSKLRAGAQQIGWEEVEIRTMVGVVGC